MSEEIRNEKRIKEGIFFGGIFGIFVAVWAITTWLIVASFSTIGGGSFPGQQLVSTYFFPLSTFLLFVLPIYLIGHALRLTYITKDVFYRFLFLLVIVICLVGLWSIFKLSFE